MATRNISIVLLRVISILAFSTMLAACPNLPSSFTCSVTSQCIFRGSQGTCEPNGACSFPDTGCASGRRYGDFAPPGIADQCVALIVDGGGGGAVDLPAPVGITRVGATNVPLGAHGTTLTLTPPGSLAAGDFLLASIFADDSGATVTAPAGWTVHADLSDNVSSNYRATWLYKRVSAGDPASYSFQLGATANSAGALVAYRGVATMAPIDAATNQMFRGAAFIAPSITASHANDMLVAGFVDAMSQGLGWTAPSGMQTAVSISQIGIFDAIQPTAGATGTREASLGLPVPGIGAVDFLALAP